MRKMRGLISIVTAGLLSLMLVSTIAGVAFAAAPPQNKDVDITATVIASVLLSYTVNAVSDADVEFGVAVDPADGALSGGATHDAAFTIKSNQAWDFTLTAQQQNGGACAGIYRMSITATCGTTMGAGTLSVQDGQAGSDIQTWTAIDDNTAKTLKNEGAATGVGAITVQYKLDVGWSTPPGAYSALHRYSLLID